jgi:hypothetical protein
MSYLCRRGAMRTVAKLYIYEQDKVDRFSYSAGGPADY